jgi:1-acyl-sn-glycerol-3-phosphate acyltransferase
VTPTGVAGVAMGRMVSPRDRVLRRVAAVVSRCFFRSVEVVGPRADRGPVIVAASHLIGFVDPVLLVAALGRLPRFLAKGTLWRIAVARPFLALARLIPVHRREDSDGHVSNTAAFASAVEALAGGATVAIFPEGTTHDLPHLVELRTGVARIALQAVDAGVADLRIAPVGIAYEDKVALRGRALVQFGEPVDVAAEAARSRREIDDDHEVVRDLMATLDRRLRAVSPDFATTLEAMALTDAAKVAVRDEMPDPRRDPPLAVSSPRARVVAHADPERRRRAVDAVAHYELVLGRLGLRDADVARSVGPLALARRVAVLAAVVVVLAPFALAGLLANALPTALVVAAGLAPRAPVTKGTVRVLVAVVVFPLTWLAIAWFDVGAGAIADIITGMTFPLSPVLGTDRSGVLASLLVFAALPLLGVAALAVVAEWGEFRAAWRSWRTTLDRRGQLDELRALRAEVVDAMAAPEREPALPRRGWPPATASASTTAGSRSP